MGPVAAACCCWCWAAAEEDEERLKSPAARPMLPDGAPLGAGWGDEPGAGPDERLVWEEAGEGAGEEAWS